MMNGMSSSSRLVDDNAKTAAMMTADDREFVYTRADFEKIRELIYRRVGIALADGKQRLVYGRLARRLRELQLQRFSEYLSLLTPDSDEWEHFVNALTTNLTAFFREQYHFPILAEHLRTVRRRPLRIWSAAASTGEEPYSIAMTLVNAFDSFALPVEIVASDIDTHVLDVARNGIYPLEQVEKLPTALKKRFFRRGKGDRAGSARVIAELQVLIDFRQLNLLDDKWPLQQRFDAIFCRNVMIYFDKPTQRKLIQKFIERLQPDGLFFAGHSESFFHASDLIAPVGRTVYRPGRRNLPAEIGDG
jgi:chemotaxis protein methyltransferase CheR